MFGLAIAQCSGADIRNGRSQGMYILTLTSLMALPPIVGLYAINRAVTLRKLLPPGHASIAKCSLTITLSIISLIVYLVLIGYITFSVW